MKYLYLSLLPEALIFSMLPPEKFGKYMAIGNSKLSRSSAIFIELDPDIDIPELPLQKAKERCVPHVSGNPRNSAYVCIYQALSRVPISALGKLHLATKDGLVLSLDPVKHQPSEAKGFYLYQEICPVYPRVVSSLSPQEFCTYVTSPSNPLFLPKLFFADLRLGGLATDPEGGDARNLPYPEIGHLRNCLLELSRKSDKKTKIVRRDVVADSLYYLIENGFYVGDADNFLFYPMPVEESLLKEHHLWWNSAIKAERY